MTCQDYGILIGDSTDGALDRRAQRELDAHLATCSSCRQVADDFRIIRAATRQLERPLPSPQVWSRIAAAIDAAPRRRRILGLTLPSWPQLAAATVVVALAAGVGWMAWRDLSPVASRAAAPLSTELQQAEAQYVTAISGLEDIANTAATELDPGTAEVIEANLTVIDTAIGESRAALRQQPASEAAQESLFEALRSKVELLQGAVALINEMRKGNEQGAARIVSGLNQ